MKKTRWIQILLIAGVAAGLAGCGQGRGTSPETVKESETQAQTQAQTSAPVVKVEEKETESEAKLITSVEYTSKDGTVKITLPDNTWKVTQDADEMRVFSSGSDAMINIVHASTESAMKTLSIQKTQEELDAALTKQYSDANAYEIQSFESKKVDTVDVYRYVVKYNAAARMWAYSVTYGIVAPDQAYVITGTVTEDNNALLKAVEDSVDSFTVLKDEELKNVTALPTVTGTTATGETNAAQNTTDANSTQENSSLASYSSNSTMYASDTVNVRSGPGTDTDVIGGFNSGDAVTVTGETNGWYQVSVNGQTGYIRKDLLGSTQPSTANTTQDAVASGESAAATSYGSAVTMYTADGVNVRSQPSTSSDVSATLGLGTAVTVVGETDNWYVVSTGSGTGYISKALLSSSAPAGLCADCDLCLRACPTKAIREEGMDARRCVSYLTIERKEPLPEEHAGKPYMGLYGCDNCQRVCPYNRGLQPDRHAELSANPCFAKRTAEDWAATSRRQKSKLLRRLAKEDN